MEEVSIFVNFANSFHPTINFTCEMSSERTVFLDADVFKGHRLLTLRILDSQAHFKPISVYTLLILPTIHCEKAFYQRRSIYVF